MTKGDKPSGGKQRVKGNLKPSSSDKAAAFLQNQGIIFNTEPSADFSLLDTGATVGFSQQLGFVPIDRDPDALKIDATLRAILKRLEKRDTITKQKALNEFLQCNDENQVEHLSEDAIMTAMPYWPRIFSSLSSDPDQKVRELNQRVMQSIAWRLKRKLAPHLKKLMATWTYAVVDSYPPVALVSRSALEDTFPDHKLSEAYRFCSAELINHLKVQLETFRNISRTTKTKDEEAGSQGPLLEVIIRFAGLLLQYLSDLSADSSSREELFQALHHEGPLWKLVRKARSQPIAMHSAFCLVKQITQCPVFLDWAAVNDAQLACFLSKFTIESMIGSVILEPQWEAALSCLTVFGAPVVWNQYVDLTQTVMPRLNRQLTRDDEPLHEDFFKSLILLLSMLPMKSTEIDGLPESQRATFKSQLQALITEALPKGLRHILTAKTPRLNLPQELQHALECYRFVIKKTMEEEDRSLAMEIFDQVMLKVFHASFSKEEDESFPIQPNLRGVVFSQVGKFLLSLAKLDDELSAKMRSLLLAKLHAEIMENAAVGLDFLSVLYADSKLRSAPWLQESLLQLVGQIATNEGMNKFPSLLLLFAIQAFVVGNLDLDCTNLEIFFEGLQTIDDEGYRAINWTGAIAHGLARLWPTLTSGFDLTRCQPVACLRFVRGPLAPLISVLTDSNALHLCEFLSGWLEHSREHFQQRTASLLTFLTLRSVFPENATKADFLQKHLQAPLIERLLPTTDVPTLLQLVNLCHSRSRPVWEALPEERRTQMLGQLAKTLVDPPLSLLGLCAPKEAENAAMLNEFSESVPEGEELLVEIGSLLQKHCTKKFFEAHYWPILLHSAGHHRMERFNQLLRFTTSLAEACHLDEDIKSRLCAQWMLELVGSTTALARQIAVRQSNAKLARFLLPRRGLLPPGLLAEFAVLLRLHLIGAMLEFVRDDLRGHPKYLFLLGCARAWLNSVAMDCGDSQLERTCPIVPADVAFLLNSLESDIVKNFNAFWQTRTQAIPLAELIQSAVPADIDAIAAGPLQAAWNATLMVRLCHTHPGEWPLCAKAAATCTSIGQVRDAWLVDHVADEAKRSLLANVAMPAGVSWRCFPRADFLRMATLFFDHKTEKFDVLLEVLAGCASIKTICPSFVGPLLYRLTDGYVADYLKESCALNEPPLASNADLFRLRATVSAMAVFESCLLLWQPWQWHDLSRDTVVTGKQQQVGLVELSFRLRQFYPRLTSSQWDTLFCLTTSWLTQATDEDHTSDNNAGARLFQERVFRLVAAMGALFLDSASCQAPWLDAVLASPKKSGILRLLSSTSSCSLESMDFAQLDPDAADEEDENLSDLSDLDEEEEEEEDEESGQPPALEQKVDYLDDLSEEESDADEDDPSKETDNELVEAQRPGYMPKRVRPASSVCTEWNQFFSSFIYSSLLPLLMRTALPLERAPGPVEHSEAWVSALSAAMTTCPIGTMVEILNEKSSLIMEHMMRMSASASASTSSIKLFMGSESKASKKALSPKIKNCIDFACKLLQEAADQPVQLLGHVLLTRLARSISSTGKRLSDLLVTKVPQSWLTLLAGSFPAELEVLVNASFDSQALSKWGCHPITAETLREADFALWHAHLLAYLVAWDAFLSLLSSSMPKNRVRLQSALLNGPSAFMLDRLVVLLGRLLPPQGSMEAYICKPSDLDIDPRLLVHSNIRTRAYLYTAGILRSAKGQKKRLRRLVDPRTRDDDVWEEMFNPADKLVHLPPSRRYRDLSVFAVNLLQRLLSEFPALIRDWRFGLTASTCEDGRSPLCGRPGQAKQLSAQFERMVAKHFSEFVCRLSLQTVQLKTQQKRGGNAKSSGLFASLLGFREQPRESTISLKTRSATKEVITCYHVSEDHSLEMVIQLPQNYPLDQITVESGKRTGISGEQWRAWLHQLSLFLNHQNGSILDGINLWHRNIRKKFDGVEECYICYSIVHNKNFTLPKMQCRVCRKRFHYYCMYKWFNTSRNPTCPMCRNVFFGGPETN